MKQWLSIRIAAAQRIEADAPMGNADLATHQAIWPILGDGVGPAQKVDSALLIATPDEDHQPFQLRVRIQGEALWKRPPRRGVVATVRGFVAVGCDIGRRNTLEGGDRSAVDAAARPCFATGR